jgi:inosine-uridine nucleoside N-ribohydrolase
VKRVILDVDTGVDDALAIALAVGHPDVRLEAVLTVAGNVSLELTTRNTLRVLDWLGDESVPVYTGAEAPLSRTVREASRWHGADGLGGAQLPNPTRCARPDAIGCLIERILAEPGALTLVCTAPLTNLALALQRDPRIVDAVQEVVLMGGTPVLPGNTTPTAEFNVFADPLAAALVFKQSWQVTMVGLNVTTRVSFSRADRDALAANESRQAVLLRELSRHLFDVRGLDSMSLHDPLALLVAVEPDLVQTIHRDVEVETEGTHTLGETVIDLRATADPPQRRTRVAIDVDAERARTLFFKTLGLVEPNL